MATKRKFSRPSLQGLNSAMAGAASRTAAVADAVVAEQEQQTGVTVPVSALSTVEVAAAAVADVNKRCGAGTLVVLSGEHMEDATVTRWQSPSLSLDSVFGGGVPDGRVVEVFGPESGGKSSLCLFLIGAYQRLATARLAAYIDVEHSYDPRYAECLGVDNSRLLFGQPTTAEEALDLTNDLVVGGRTGLIVVDSVAALVPKAELEGESGQQLIGLQARLMSQALRKLAGNCARSGATVLFVNQIRQKVGVVFGNPEVTPGGNALKFYASVRLEVRRGAAIKIGETQVGNQINVKSVKNKTAPPFQSATLDLYYARGLDTMAELLDLCHSCGLVQVAGAWYSYRERRLGQGREGACNTLRGDEALVAELSAAYRNRGKL